MKNDVLHAMCERRPFSTSVTMPPKELRVFWGLKQAFISIHKMNKTNGPNLLKHLSAFRKQRGNDLLRSISRHREELLDPGQWLNQKERQWGPEIRKIPLATVAVGHGVHERRRHASGVGQKLFHLTRNKSKKH